MTAVRRLHLTNDFILGAAYFAELGIMVLIEVLVGIGGHIHVIQVRAGRHHLLFHRINLRRFLEDLPDGIHGELHVLWLPDELEDQLHVEISIRTR